MCWFKALELSNSLWAVQAGLRHGIDADMGAGWRRGGTGVSKVKRVQFSLSFTPSLNTSSNSISTIHHIMPSQARRGRAPAQAPPHAAESTPSDSLPASRGRGGHPRGRPRGRAGTVQAATQADETPVARTMRTRTAEERRPSATVRQSTSFPDILEYLLTICVCRRRRCCRR
jgi:hypothetical protein